MNNDTKLFIAFILLMIVSAIGWISFLNVNNTCTNLQNQQRSIYETGYLDGQKDYASGVVVIEKVTRTEWTTTQPVVNPFRKRDN